MRILFKDFFSFVHMKKMPSLKRNQIKGFNFCSTEKN